MIEHAIGHRRVAGGIAASIAALVARGVGILIPIWVFLSRGSVGFACVTAIWATLIDRLVRELGIPDGAHRLIATESGLELTRGPKDELIPWSHVHAARGAFKSPRGRGISQVAVLVERAGKSEVLYCSANSTHEEFELFLGMCRARLTAPKDEPRFVRMYFSRRAVIESFVLTALVSVALFGIVGGVRALPIGLIYPLASAAMEAVRVRWVTANA